jgi:hypothetical protein
VSNVLDFYLLQEDLNLKSRDLRSNCKHKTIGEITFLFIRAEFSRSAVDGRSDFVARSSSEVSDEGSI